MSSEARKIFNSIVEDQFKPPDEFWEISGIAEKLPHITDHPELRELAIHLWADHYEFSLLLSPEKDHFDNVYADKSDRMRTMRWDTFDELCLVVHPDRLRVFDRPAEHYGRLLLTKNYLSLQQNNKDLEQGALTPQQMCELMTLIGQTTACLLQQGRDHYGPDQSTDRPD